MMNRNLAKKILAFILAALIGLSALGTLVMAFADDGSEPTEEFTVSAVEDGYRFVEPNDDFALAVADQEKPLTTVELGESGKILFDGSKVPHLWVGFTNDESTAVYELSQQVGTWFDVVDFTFHDKLAADISVEIFTKNPYLYRFGDGKLTAISSTYNDGVHSFATDQLGCFLASPTKVD